MSKLLKIAIKSIISIGIVYYLFSNLSFSLVKEVLREVRFEYVFLALLLYFLAQMLSAYKWSIIAHSLDFKKSYREFFSYYFIGMFFNLFMLGSIGGDLIKAFYLSSNRKEILTAYYSTFLDRFMGGLCLITILAFASVFSLRGKIFSYWVLPLILIGTSFVWILTISMPKIIDTFSFLKSIGRKIGLDRIKVFWENPRIALYPLFISFVFQMLFIFIIVILGKSFGLSVPIRYFFVFVPLSDLLSVIPITINGLGLREGVFVFFLNHLNIENSKAVIFSFLSTGVVWAVSLLGGIIYILGGERKSKKIKGGEDGEKLSSSSFGFKKGL